MPMAAQTRLAHFFDNGEYQRGPVREVPQDPLSSALHVLLDRFGCPTICLSASAGRALQIGRMSGLAQGKDRRVARSEQGAMALF